MAANIGEIDANYRANVAATDAALRKLLESAPLTVGQGQRIMRVLKPERGPAERAKVLSEIRAELGITEGK